MAIFFGTILPWLLIAAGGWLGYQLVLQNGRILVIPAGCVGVAETTTVGGRAKTVIALAGLVKIASFVLCKWLPLEAGDFPPFQ